MSAQPESDRTSPAADFLSGVGELGESQHLLQRIAETSPDVLYVSDLANGRTTYVNARSEQVVGYTAEEVMALGERFAITLWHPDDVTKLPEHRRQLQELADGEVVEFEYRVRQPDGTYRWLLSRVTVFARANDGQVRQIIVAMQNISERKRAEEHLAYHALLLENVHDAIVAADERLILTAWNRAAEEMYGWRAAEVLGRDLREVVRSEYPEDKRAEAFRILAETGHFRTDAIHHRKDDTPFWIEGNIIALRGAAGQVSGYVYAYHDITERKRAEEQLRRAHDDLEQRVIERTSQLSASNAGQTREITERRRAEEELRRSEAYLTEAQRLSHTASWAWDVSTGNLFWSLEHFRILGLDPELAQPSYESFYQMVHAQDRPSVKQTFERAVRARGDYEMDYRIIRPDGMIRHIHSLAHPAFNDSGELTEYIGTIIDISERKRAEEALRDSNKELQSLNEKLTVTSEELEVSKDELQAVNQELEGRLAEVSQLNSDLQNLMLSTEIGTIFLDRWLRIKRYTPQIPRLFNIRPADINRPVWHLTHRLDHVDLQADALQVLADFQSVEREVRSAEGHWYIVRLLPYRTQDDTIDGVVVTFVEITERKRTEAALRETQAELAHAARVATLGELTASIAHEVNQPLAAIVTNGHACLRLLARATPDLAGVQEAVESTISDALRASEVIKRIRALLRKTGTEKVLLNVNETIQEVIALAAGELGKNQVLLRTELAAGLRPVLGDQVQLQQVLLNLILNANDAMSVAGSQPRQLQISSQASKPAEVMVTVRDSGPGLDPQTAERVFDAFFTTKTKGDGLGLGLSISRTIIEAHGGRLWATPNEGQGATFRFTLPTSGENQGRV